MSVMFLVPFFIIWYIYVYIYIYDADLPYSYSYLPKGGRMLISEPTEGIIPWK